VLYFELGELGFLRILLPVVLISINLYLVGNRWYRRTDGRFDYRQLVSTNAEPVLKAQYAFGTAVIAWSTDITND